FWHQAIVSMVTMLFLLLVIERVQYLELSGCRRGALLWGGARLGRGWGGLYLELSGCRRGALLWGVPTLGLAFGLLLLHYGPGRAYGMVLMAWWAGSTVWGAIQDWRAGRP